MSTVSTQLHTVITFIHAINETQFVHWTNVCVWCVIIFTDLTRPSDPIYTSITQPNWQLPKIARKTIVNTTSPDCTFLSRRNHLLRNCNIGKCSFLSTIVSKANWLNTVSASFGDERRCPLVRRCLATVVDQCVTEAGGWELTDSGPGHHWKQTVKRLLTIFLVIQSNAFSAWSVSIFWLVIDVRTLCTVQIMRSQIWEAAEGLNRHSISFCSMNAAIFSWFKELIAVRSSFQHRQSRCRYLTTLLPVCRSKQWNAGMHSRKHVFLVILQLRGGWLLS